MTIKHLVIGGGGPNGFMFFGALKYLKEKLFWNNDNIKSIYTTSAGSLIGTLMSLNYNLNDIENYILKRPWDKLQPIEPENILNIWSEKGIFDEKFVLDIINPLLKCLSLYSNINLKEFYEFNNIDLHIFTSKIKNGYFETIDLNHKSYPDLELYKAITMSSAFPIAFKPIEYNGEYYIDGGLCNNFPLNFCLTETKCNKDEILAINYSKKSNDENYLINNNTNVINYTMKIILNMKYMISNEHNQEQIKNIITMKNDYDDFTNWKKSYSSEEHRKYLLDKGKEYAINFLQFFENNNNDNDNEKISDNDIYIDKE
jgi:NTE family protein